MATMRDDRDLSDFPDSSEGLESDEKKDHRANRIPTVVIRKKGACKPKPDLIPQLDESFDGREDGAFDEVTGVRVPDFVPGNSLLLEEEPEDK